MEDALLLLKKNDEDVVRSLKALLNHPKTKFSTVQLAVSAVKTATSCKKVGADITHLAKYIHLVNLIGENNPHREHLGTDQWQALADFLFVASRIAGELDLNALTYARTISDVTRGLSLLLEADEAIVPVYLLTILRICESVLDKTGPREASCHLYVMRCARKLVFLGLDAAESLANYIFQLGKVRSPELQHELLLFACMKNQANDTLLGYGIPIIPSSQVDFANSAPEISLEFFRPSAEADLPLFVGAQALANSRDKSLSTNPGHPKRVKTELSGQIVMSMVFRNTVSEAEAEEIREWLNSSRAAEDLPSSFWALVALALRNSKSLIDICEEWDLALRFISYRESSSGASFLLSSLVPQLLDSKVLGNPTTDSEREVVRRLKNLAGLMASSSYPHLSSGSLMLYSAMAAVKVLDLDFQAFIKSSLRTWFANQLRDAHGFHMINQLLDYNAPIAYFRDVYYTELKMANEYQDTQRIREKNLVKMPLPLSKTLIAPVLSQFKDDLHLDSTKPKNIYESLVLLALAAQSGSEIPQHLHISKTAAFSDSDLKAFCWFAGLAVHIDWPTIYTDTALSLADWSVPANEHHSVLAALQLLRKPSILVTNIISGTTPTRFEQIMACMSGNDLLELEMFMKSYTHQRSPWVLNNLCALISMPMFKHSNEEKQLAGFFLKVSSSQSSFSRLKKSLVRYETLSNDQFANVLQGMSESSQLAILPYISERKMELKRETIAVFKDRMCASIYLSYHGCFSRAQLILMEPSLETINILSTFPDINGENRDQILSAFLVPMFLSNHDILSTESPLIRVPARRAVVFLRPFSTLDLSLSLSDIAAIVEQLLKEIQVATDSEKVSALQMSHQFILSHVGGSELANSLVDDIFLENACASVTNSDHHALNFIEELAQKQADNGRCSVRGSMALFNVGLCDLAMSFLRNSPGSMFKRMINFDLKRDLKMMIFELNTQGWSEAWNFFIHLVAQQIDTQDFNDVCKACEDITRKEVESLIIWSDYLEIKNEKMSAVLGYLGIRLQSNFIKGLQNIWSESPDSQRENHSPLLIKRAGNFGTQEFSPDDRQDSPAIPAKRGSVTIVDIDQLDSTNSSVQRENTVFQTFLSNFDYVYALLPYKKRRVLNAFVLRSPSFETTAIGLSDIFGEQNWNLEHEFRPVCFEINANIPPGVVKAAQTLSDFSLRVLNQPTLGPGVVNQVPELVPHVIPLLVTAAYSETLESQIEVSSTRETLVKAVNDCLMSSEDEQIQLAINVQVQCYKQGLPQMISNEDIALVCFSRFKFESKFAKYYAEIGSMFIEISWNRDPETELTEEILEALQAFYEKLSENEDLDLRYALPEQRKVPGLSQVIDRCHQWQKLKANMVFNEIKPDSVKGKFKDQSEKLGLWRLAQQIEASTNVNDLEKAWWLNQWEAYVRDPNDESDFYVREDYGKLIDFVDDNTDHLTVLAELYDLRTPLITSMVKMLSDDVRIIAQDPVAAKGYEIKVLNCGNYEKYLSLTKVEFSQAFEKGDVLKSLEAALKLENVAAGASIRSQSKISAENKSRLLIEAKTASLIRNAHIEWMIGQQSTAIQSLKSLLPKHNDKTEMSSKSCEALDIGEIYCQIGSWSREARDEPDEQILRSYFLESVKFANSSNSEKIYHSFALFCSEAYQDSFLQSSIQDAKHIVNNLTPQFKHISKLIRDGMVGLDEEKKRKLQKMYRSIHAQLKARNNDLLELQTYKKSLLIRCAENYIMSMAAGDTYDDGDMAALISVWLKYHLSTELNEAVAERLISKDDSELLVPSKKFLPWISQLSSRISQPSLASNQHETPLFQRILQTVLTQATQDHPYHTVWHLLKVSRTAPNEHKDAQERAKAAETIIKAAQSRRHSNLIAEVAEFYERLIELGSAKSPSDLKKSYSLTITSLLGRRKGSSWRGLFSKIHVPVPTVSIPVREDRDYSNVPHIGKMIEPIKTAGGISAPKILEFVDSSGNHQQCLLKTSNDDLRQDAIMEQVFSTASQMLTRKSPNLYVRTYNVVPLSATIGMIEFVKNTVALIDILESMHKKHGGKRELSISQARKAMSASRAQGRTQRIAGFKEVMRHTKPQMRNYWPQKFKDATQWLTAKTKWCRSTAVMSILGYIIGLGDRHCSNLLVDSNSGDVVHIDLGIAFDQGKLLLIPETVPFRLTRDIVDGMGIIGTNGVFMTSAEETLQQLRSNESQIMTVLEVLRHDTLYTWKLPETVLRHAQIDDDAHHLGFVMPSNAANVDNGQAEHALLGVKSKLQNSLSCEATVRDLVTQARDPTNLALIYEGWCPFY